jgi:RNA polymerase sigma-70 factor (ECF subfamily)
VDVHGQKDTVANVPPVVVKTVPQAGDTRVDPNLKEIRVTFSKDMRNRTWSCVKMSKDTLPRIIGQPRYEQDSRTWVIRVELQPNRTYALWFNQGWFEGFMDVEQRPAIPYLLVFRTDHRG